MTGRTDRDGFRCKGDADHAGAMRTVRSPCNGSRYEEAAILTAAMPQAPVILRHMVDIIHASNAAKAAKRALSLEGVDNVRDLGGIPVYGNRVVKPGLIFRGAALSGATAADRRVLFEELAITCVIDLRCGWEVEAKPNPRHPNVDYLHIPFYDKEKVGIEYEVGAVAGQKVGRDVACDPDDFYRSLTNPRTVAQMRECLAQTIARTTNGLAVYQHCSGGKDRTGVMTLLVLTVLGASFADILEDYLFTNASRDTRFQETYAKFLRIAKGDERLALQLVNDHRARRQNLEAFLEAVSKRYGGIDAFVREQLGIGDALREEFRAACTCPA